MKKFATGLFALFFGIGIVWAQGKAEIKFNEMVHDFGQLSDSVKVLHHTFTFTNVGEGPLVIHQVFAHCGCTVTEYTQEPVLPGKTGTIEVTYDRNNMPTGYFRKGLTIRTNARTEMLRLYIEGDVEDEAEE